MDRFFANNKDQSSYIGYVIILIKKHSYANTNKFLIKNNPIHQSLTKCQNVIQSVLASMIYCIVNKFDLKFVIKQIFAIICKKIVLLKILLILYSKFYLLYQCFVQLRTIIEKRLMIDIMVLKQSHKGQKIDKIKQICGKNNPANAITKTSPNLALERMISTNKTIIRLKRWIK